MPKSKDSVEIILAGETASIENTQSTALSISLLAIKVAVVRSCSDQAGTGAGVFCKV
jgi:hypothetical protein